MRTKILAACVSAMTLVSATACENTADKQRKADQAEIHAENDRANADFAANQRPGSSATQAQQQAAQQQRKADEAQNSAFAELGKEEGTYARKLADKLANLDTDITELHGVIAAEPDALKKAEDQTARDDAVIGRDTLVADQMAIPYATTMSWPD